MADQDVNGLRLAISALASDHARHLEALLASATALEARLAALDRLEAAVQQEAAFRARLKALCLAYDRLKGLYPESPYEGLALYQYVLDGDPYAADGDNELLESWSAQLGEEHRSRLNTGAGSDAYPLRAAWAAQLGEEHRKEDWRND